MKLKDIAYIERAKNNKIYPKHTSIIQISATRGQVEFLEEDTTVPARYAVVTPKEEMPLLYLFTVIEMAMDNFMKRYSTGLNIQIEILGDMDIKMASEEKRQKLHDFELMYKNLQQKYERQLQLYKDIKEENLDSMFVGGE